MQFLMLTYVSEEGAAHYEQQSDEERAAGIAEHEAWFGANAGVIRGGHELAWPRRVGRIRADQQLKIMDGPFAETKEALGGVIILEADSLEQAAGIAAGWPSLRLYPGASVEVVPTTE
jgi:hypothetical protein